MKQFLMGFLLAALLCAGGYWFFVKPSPAGSAEEGRPVQYHCPMHPFYVSDLPGNCPICGMSLVVAGSPEAIRAPVGHEEAGDLKGETPPEGHAAVHVTAEQQRLMGIVLAEARRMNFEQEIRTVGRVTSDETRLHHVHTKFEGFIEELFVNYQGQYVRKGDPLFSVYSPELLATQKEYLLALKASREIPSLPGGEIGSVDLVGAARRRLSLWDIDDVEIQRLEETGEPSRALTVYSSVSGYVTAKMAVQGLRISPGDNLYDIIDLSTVWVLADVYEVNLPFVQLGQWAWIRLPYETGRVWRGRLTFINPTLEEATRTVKVRIEIPNPGGILKPEMYADVILKGTLGNGIGVPESAVLSTGERNIVFVAGTDGLFQPREVTLGVRSRDFYELKSGVLEGEKVVTGANFLLDSESRLSSALASMNERGGRSH